MGISDYKLKLEKGSAITHFGSIKRIDGVSSLLQLDELSLFLEALHLFLSFARGSILWISCSFRRSYSNHRRVLAASGAPTNPASRGIEFYRHGRML